VAARVAQGRHRRLVDLLVNSTTTLLSASVTTRTLVKPYWLAIFPVRVLRAASSAEFVARTFLYELKLSAISSLAFQLPRMVLTLLG
jgi:hypothetical protein